MNIAILNVYDVRNRGDLAILVCEMEWLRRKIPGAKFQLFSRFHRENARLFPGISIGTPFGADAGVSASAGLFGLLGDHFKALLPGVARRDARFRAFGDADVYALTGGGYLYSSRFPLLSRNLFTLCEGFLMACRTGKPVLQFPQSFGPLTKPPDRWIVRRLCRALPRLAPRCEQSMSLLRGWGFAGKSTVMPDIVLMMRELFPGWFSDSGRREGLGIAPVECGFAQKMDSSKRARYLSDLAEVGAAFHRRTGEPVRLFSQVTVDGSDDDSPAIRDLRRELEARNVPATEIERGLDLERYVAEFGRVRAFIGCRMHACIFSFVAHTPVLGLAYQPKFIGTFEAMGAGGRVRPIQNWDADWAIAELDSILAAGEGERKRLAGRLREVARGIDGSLSAALDSACAGHRQAVFNQGHGQHRSTQ